MRAWLKQGLAALAVLLLTVCPVAAQDSYFKGLWPGFKAAAAVPSFGSPYEAGPLTSDAVSSTTKTWNTNVEIPSGDTLVIAVLKTATTGALISSIADNSLDGVSWTASGELSSNGRKYRMFSKKVGTGWSSGRTVTVTFSTSTGGQVKQIIGLAFSGGAAIDNNLTGASGASTAPAISYSGLVSTPQMAVVMMSQTTGFPSTLPAGFSAITSPGGNTAAFILYAGVVNLTADTLTFGLSSSDTWWVQAQTFTRGS